MNGLVQKADILSRYTALENVRPLHFFLSFPITLRRKVWRNRRVQLAVASSNVHSNVLLWQALSVFSHIKVTFCTVLQRDAILKVVRFEKPSVKMTFDLVTQRY